MEFIYSQFLAIENEPNYGLNSLGPGSAALPECVSSRRLTLSAQLRQRHLPVLPNLEG